MPGLLVDSAASVIRRLLVNLGLGTEPALLGYASGWPVYATSEPGSPDEVITVLDTDDKQNGRAMFGGERQEHHGIRIRVRAATHSVGYAKARAIAIALDETVYQERVTVDALTYLVHCINRTTDVIADGKNPPTDKRSTFRIDALVSLRLDS